MRHETEESKAERATNLGDGSAAGTQGSRELTEAELAHISGGVQKVREAAPPY